MNISTKSPMKFLKVLSIFILMAILMKTPIFNTLNYNDLDKAYLENIFNDKFVQNDICLLQYQYTTGGGWFVVESSNSTLVHKQVVIHSMFDPRYLKDNKEFDIDYTGMLLIEVKKEKCVSIDEENLPVLYADNIMIIFDTDKNNYLLHDLSISGIFKFILGLFNSKYWLSY